VADEQMIKLLEEIRDLQEAHIENYKDALKNQQESIDMQKRALRRQKAMALMLGLFLLVLIVLNVWSWHP
jgi:cytoskeletal protein RodZ